MYAPLNRLDLRFFRRFGAQFNQRLHQSWRHSLQQQVRRLSTLTLCAVIYLGAIPLAYAYDPTAFMQSHVPGTKRNGDAELRRYGKPVYSAALYVNPDSFSPDDLTREPFAIDLAYQKACSGRSLASNIASTMRDMGAGSSAQRKDWNAQLARLLPNLSANDHLTAVFSPGQGTGFFRNGDKLGDIGGNGFARAFFGIWLNTKSTMPGVRQGLLNGSS